MTRRTKREQKSTMQTSSTAKGGAPKNNPQAGEPYELGQQDIGGLEAQLQAAQEADRTKRRAEFLAGLEELSERTGFILTWEMVIRPDTQPIVILSPAATR